MLTLHHKYNIDYAESNIFGIPGATYAEPFLRPRTTEPLDPNVSDFPRLGADLSFEAGIHPRQMTWLNIVMAGLGIGIIMQPALTLTALSWSLFAVFTLLIAWRMQLLFVGLGVRLARRNVSLMPAHDLELPVYSVLVPVYKEAALMPQLAEALSRLNWPPNRLDIQILLEADDADTIVAARDAQFQPPVRLTLVKPGGPRTKPNALNVGLVEARGQYVTVYDVEDFPHPDQLHAAFQGFQSVPADMVCLQAPLVGAAEIGGWLSAQWSLEYAVQFGLLLPGAALYRMPLLIGGTSNHFRKEALQALGGWDAWNVTEDADLGMRIARAGLSSGVISVPTSEDPPKQLAVWLAQRSRWIKGFMQTWLVLMRAPVKTLDQMGAVPFIVMQLQLGGAILAPLFHLPCTLLLFFIAFCEPFMFGIFGSSLLATALTIGFIGDICAPGPRSLSRWIATVTRPLYWLLHSLAAYRAIWELAKAPFFWAKTPHTPRNMKDTSSCSTGSSASACF